MSTRYPLIVYWYRFRSRFHKRFLQKRKLAFIHWFFHQFPGKYCWADAVSWAFAPDRYNPFKLESSIGCEIESRDHEHKLCYCGGWNDGVCFDKLPKAEQDRIRDQHKREISESELPF